MYRYQYHLLFIEAQNEIFATESVHNSLFVVQNWTNNLNKDIFCMDMILQRQNSILLFSMIFKVEFSVRYEQLIEIINYLLSLDKWQKLGIKPPPKLIEKMKPGNLC